MALKLILRNLDVERRGVMQCMNLKCPNLLTIFDLKANDAGETFVVMEYVAGPSLASVLKQYPNGMPIAEVRHWLKGLVEGVAYLHDHGIVHRDLKPANLFMEEGIVKIGDYGLAKLITPSQGTEHSESIGTCHYMAPEIGSGKYNKPIDVYAIGVILYEMLTGRVPFDGETVNEVLMKHLTARPDVSMLPEPYRTIVAKALAKDPNARPARVYDLLPPGDAPREPEVRIIGEAKAGGGSGAGCRPAGAAGGGRPADRGRGAGVLHRPRDPAAPPAGADAGAAVRGPACGTCGEDAGRRPRGAAAARSTEGDAGGRPRARRAARQRTGGPAAVRAGAQPRPASGGPQPAAAGARAPAAAAGTAPAPAARAARHAQRAGPVRRAGRLDALGRAAGGAPDPPRGRRAGDRPGAASAAGGVPLPSWPCWGPGRP